MYAIMFETKKGGAEQQIISLLTSNGFLKCALPGSHIYRHKSDNLMKVHIMLNKMIELYKSDLLHIFVCKMDDVSDFSDELR